MNGRDSFIQFVRNGGAPICSPQIGGGAGFDTKLAGKEWISHTTLGDTLTALERFDIAPFVNLGLCDLSECNPALAWRETSCETVDGKVVREYALETPKGKLTRCLAEQKIAGVFQEKYPIQKPEELDVLEYYIDSLQDGDFSPITRYTRNLVDQVGGRAPVCIQWAVQPYELLCFPNTVDTVMMSFDRPEQFTRLMDKIVVLDESIMRAVAEGGADFIFLGGPGAEMISPRFYEDYLIPYSQAVTSIAHSLGLMIYSHICSPIEPFLGMGFYNRMGIDLFETLSPPPVGNIKSLRDAREKIDASICTRGNLGLDVLLNATPETVREKTFEILESTEGYKHVVAASDYLFYGVPEENVHAMAAAVRERNS